MTIRDRLWPYAITVLAAASSAIVLLDVGAALRAPVVLAFVLVCPGMALVRLLRLEEPAPELLLAVVASLCVAAILASVSIYAGTWNPPIVLIALVTVAMAAVVVDTARMSRSAL